MMILSIVALISYLSYRVDTSSKIKFLKITHLSNITLSNEAQSLRFRNESGVMELLYFSPEAREQSPSSFIYSHSSIIKSD